MVADLLFIVVVHDVNLLTILRGDVKEKICEIAHSGYFKNIIKRTLGIPFLVLFLARSFQLIELACG